jgi:RNA polymerase sigma factor (TIGR02999 family)
MLVRWGRGDQQALDQLTPIIYNDLRRVARALLTHERPEHTLSATALVHEAYVRLIDQHRVQWQNRTHFFGAAARVMRRVLVDHARARSAAKRGGDWTKVVLDPDVAIDRLADDVLDLDSALSALESLDSRKARVVEMKCFAGMTNAEIASALDVSGATVERDWSLARAWLINAVRTRL